ncbi:MAG: metal ABC transporter substrate-binding protein [Treponemataceae bacterium]|nr:metal ABC transporter substrate-binding protein [Treponemataceae bacterium]
MEKLKQIFILLLCIAALFFTGCTKSGKSSESEYKIVVTNFACYDFARAIICGVNDDLTARNLDESDFSLRLLIKPGMELHSFDPSPADIIAIQNSDLFIYIGGESDEWVEKILASSEKKPANILRMLDYVDPLEEEIVEGMEIAHDHHHHGHDEAEEEDAHEHEGEHEEFAHEHEEEHEHEGEFDEHIWTSSINARKMIEQIKNQICSLDSENAEIYEANAILYSAQISELSEQIRREVESSETKLIVMGDRFPLRYFAKEYGLEYRAAFSGCSSAVEAKTTTISYLIDFAKENKVAAIFSIEMSNQKLAKTIADACGLPVLELHSCHNVTKKDFDSGVTYAMTMQRNLASLSQGLR